MRLTFHAEADAEVTEAALYYGMQAESFGLSFLEELDAALERIEAHPKATLLVGREVRRAILRRFPFSVLYVIEPDRIRILAVAHQKRRPNYWLDRL
jgi:plasmid stabilization system protein ParE